MPAGEKGSSQRAFLQAPFAFPCARCSLCGFSPLDTRPYSQPRGLMLPAASLHRRLHPAGSRAAELASARPRSPPSPVRRCSALSPAAQGPGRGREIRFHGLQPFYFINCSAKPDSFAGALHSFYPSSLSIGVGVAVLLFLGSVTLSKTFWRFLPSSGQM